MPPLEVVLQQAFNGLMLGVMYALIAVGFTLFFGVLDVIHFSHGDIFMLGAFAGLTLTALWKAAGLAARPWPSPSPSWAPSSSPALSAWWPSGRA